MRLAAHFRFCFDLKKRREALASRPKPPLTRVSRRFGREARASRRVFRSKQNRKCAANLNNQTQRQAQNRTQNLPQNRTQNLRAPTRWEKVEWKKVEQCARPFRTQQGTQVRDENHTSTASMVNGLMVLRVYRHSRLQGIRVEGKQPAWVHTKKVAPGGVVMISTTTLKSGSPGFKVQKTQMTTNSVRTEF